MTYAITAALIITFVLGVLATLAIWSRRGPARTRGLAVVAFVLGSPLAAASLGMSLGWPIPLYSGLTAPAGEWVVLGVKMVIGKGIFVLIDDGDVPRYYSLPWSNKMADKLQDMLDKGEKPMVTIPPFELSWDRHPPSFQPMPQPRVLPTKPREEPRKYERSAGVNSQQQHMDMQGKGDTA